MPGRVRSRIAPLWTVVPRVAERPRGVRPDPDPDPDPVALDRWLTPRIEGLIGATEGRPGWIDAGHVEAQMGASAAALWRVTTRSGLRLVTGLERPPRLQRYVADLAFTSGRGLGIRVLLDGRAGEGQAGELSALVARLCLPAAGLDLILDLGPVVDAEESAKSALTALDLLVTLIPWRDIVLLSGGFPRPVEGLGDHSHLHVPRLDRHVYRTVRAARPTARHMLYGDYGVEEAQAANRPRADKAGPPWGLMRYTTADTFLVARAPTRGPDRAERVRAVAHGIVHDRAFRGAGHSAGERWLFDCAHGTGSRGTGNPESWIKAGHVQHMVWVVEQRSGATGA
ncbi:hypothetical protein GCM10010431_01780 [Streptomyces kunmingensis]